MLKPKISIITVVRNAKIELERTINSVINLNYSNVEYIVIDGNSTDGTKEVIERSSLNITRWISESDSGIYDAMNKALKLATGDYVWFMNAGDTIYSPDILNDIFSGLENYADIYYGETMILSEDLEPKGLRGKRPPRRSLTVNSFRYGMSVCHQSIIIKRAIAPLYDTQYRYCADIDWVLASIKNTKSTINCKQIISNFIEGGLSSQKKRESLIERYKIMVKYYGKLRTLLYHAVIALKMFNCKYRKPKHLLRYSNDSNNL